MTNTLVVGGDNDPLLPRLLDDIERAEQVDVAVGFVMQSGLDLIIGSLKNLCDFGGRIRLITGDYLGITDPQALRELLNLQEYAPQSVEVRVFETENKTSFHPKGYLLSRAPRSGVAYIGSSNLSVSALGPGIEWNLRADDEATVAAVRNAFELLFEHRSAKALSLDWIGLYESQRPSRNQIEWAALAGDPPVLDTYDPTPIQREALKDLIKTREHGNKAGLVVLATGLGKTFLAAFDSNRPEFKRILFVAHREEILSQARATFRKVRPTASVGLYTGAEKQPDADILFASVQTLSRLAHLRKFWPDHFDYIVIDEFHHATASTYQKLIDYFEPKFLLGLTATPERSDGGCLLSHCGENLVYRCDLADGIRMGELCPFQYYGVPDTVDYDQVPWRNGGFLPEALDGVVAHGEAAQVRAQNAYEQLTKLGGQRTVAFCCSRKHAQYMRAFFQGKGLRAAAVHSGEGSDPRTRSLSALGRGELDVLCCVDMFNEGLDIPSIDTVMMLRPTESRIIFLQQLGRGLRKSLEKEALTVIDYIGNHRSFRMKPQALLCLGDTDFEVARALQKCAQDLLDLPPNCTVTYELEAMKLLSSQLSSWRGATWEDLELEDFEDGKVFDKPRTYEPGSKAQAEYYQTFLELKGQRPTAQEMYHQGFDMRQYAKWLDFLVDDHVGVSTSERREIAANRSLLLRIATTKMSKCYKMLVLLGMLRLDAFPGSIGIDEIVRSVFTLVDRSARLRSDVGEKNLSTPAKLRSLLEKNPLKYLSTGQEKEFFNYEDGMFSTSDQVSSEEPAVLASLVREICNWKLTEYLER